MAREISGVASFTAFRPSCYDRLAQMADRTEQRSTPRLTASFKVRYESFDQFLTEYTEDLCRGGMFLATRTLLPLNSVITCELYLPSSDDKVRIIGRVAHVLTEADATGRKRKPGMGIEFLDIP